MRYEQPSLGQMSSYNPFLMPRPGDFGIASMLGSSPYLPGLSFPNPFGPSAPSPFLPRFPSLSPEELFSAQHACGMQPAQPEDDGVTDEPKVELEGKDLWDSFHQLGTEMVITKSGR